MDLCKKLYESNHVPLFAWLATNKPNKFPLYYKDLANKEKRFIIHFILLTLKIMTDVCFSVKISRHSLKMNLHQFPGYSEILLLPCGDS